MTKERLKSSLIFIVIFFISFVISQDPITPLSSEGWEKFNYEEYPNFENNEVYLYFQEKGRNSGREGFEIIAKAPIIPPDKETLKTVEVKFKYWGFGGEYNNDDQSMGTTHFRVGVSLDPKDKPNTKYATFEKVLQDKEWAEFKEIITPSADSELKDRARIMILPKTSATGEPIGNFFVAIKNIEIVYTFTKTAPKEPSPPDSPNPPAEEGEKVDPPAEEGEKVGPPAEEGEKVGPPAGEGENPEAPAEPSRRRRSAPKVIRRIVPKIMRADENDAATETEQKITLSCKEPLDCDQFFRFDGGQWSEPNFPSRPEGFTNFLTVVFNRPNGYEIPLKTPQCIHFSYWIMGKANLSINVKDKSNDHSFTTLLTSTNKLTVEENDNIPYQWYKTKICPSIYAPQVTIPADESTNKPADKPADEAGDKPADEGDKKDDNAVGDDKKPTEKPTSVDLVISFEAIIPIGDSDCSVAIEEIGTENLIADTLIRAAGQEFPIILESWSRSDLTKDWLYEPGNLFEISDEKIGETEKTQKILSLNVPKGSGRAQILSRWVEYDPNHNLGFKVEIERCPQELSILVAYINEKGRRLSHLHLECAGKNNNLKNMQQNLYMPTFKSDSGPEKLEQIRVEFTIEWHSNAVLQNKLNFRAIDLSDACRTSEGQCGNRGKCEVLAPNEHKCHCDPGFFGKNCENIDYCVTKEKILEKIEATGDEFCKERGGKCLKERFYPQSHAVCECTDNKVWNLKQAGPDDDEDFSCADLSKCAGMNAFCTLGSSCREETGKCDKCDPGYEVDKKDEGRVTCKRIDQCKNKKCGKGAQCKVYNDEAVCYCPDGLQYSEEKGCLMNECNYRVKKALGCAQTCQMGGDGAIQCSCFNGYSLNDDKKTCKPSEPCKASCEKEPHSLCVVENSSKGKLYKCECESGYLKVLIDGDQECKDICTLAKEGNKDAVEEVKSVCSGFSECSMNSGNIKCDCKSPYKADSNGLCLVDRTCLEGNDGHKVCSLRGGICIPKIDKESSRPYACSCSLGTRWDSSKNHCVDQCDDEKQCLYENAVCQISYDDRRTEPHCACQAGLKKVNDKCVIIEKSIRAQMIMRLDPRLIERKIVQQNRQFLKRILRSPTGSSKCEEFVGGDIGGCIDYLTKAAQDRQHAEEKILIEKAVHETLVENLKKDLAGSFGRLIGEVQVLHYERLENGSTSYGLGGDYLIALTMEQKSASVSAENQFVIKLDERCVKTFGDTSVTEKYCLIPQNTVITRETIIQSDYFEPCKEEYDDYCPANTICGQDPTSSNFNCTCLPGYEAEARIPMVLMDGKKGFLQYFKEYCRDIDECAEMKNPCEPGSRCRNLPGSYDCPCLQDYQKIDGKCTEICSQLSCANGRCEVVGNHTGVCVCDEGFTGKLCDTPDPHAVKWKTGFITITIVLGLLVIVTAFVAAVMVKKNHHPKKFDENSNSVRILKMKQQKTSNDSRGPYEQSRF
ncbi:uncharacterized protein LOC141852561 isoform X2 [Brevipalpus obovatus]|uniref:uncharacterized protein LOC141852561 isoform X2 n=1 Tax=Brevipalpus obovatus TaxID=246614 RepID=UPI003D9DBCF3